MDKNILTILTECKQLELGLHTDLLAAYENSDMAPEAKQILREAHGVHIANARKSLDLIEKNKMTPDWLAKLAEENLIAQNSFFDAIANLSEEDKEIILTVKNAFAERQQLLDEGGIKLIRAAKASPSDKWKIIFCR